MMELQRLTTNELLSLCRDLHVPISQTAEMYALAGDTAVLYGEVQILGQLYHALPEAIAYIIASRTAAPGRPLQVPTGALCSAPFHSLAIMMLLILIGGAMCG